MPETFLLAPDSFKGTLSAAEVVAALARGFTGAGVPVDECPLADGGEGTLDALAGALGAELLEAEVHDPLGRLVRARFGIRGKTGIVEAAQAIGLGLVEPGRRDAVAASSAGAGELILAALAAGAREILVGVGGSATTDGGRGAVDAVAAAGGLGGARLTVLCDVRTAWEDAAGVFAPQKGADEEQVRTLAARLARMAGELRRDPRGVAMTGAAGGLAGGLWSELGAQLAPGAPAVLSAVGFDARMRAARAVVTGEGCLDEQSLAGKLVGEVATRARQAGVPCYAVAGRCRLDRFGLRMLDLDRVLEAGTPAELERAAALLLAPAAAADRSGTGQSSS